MTNITDYARKSLNGLWVGDCVGNLGTLYFAHDILKALSEGVAKFGGQLTQYHKQFQYSDDTEEAIVLVNHIRGKPAFSKTPLIEQDKLAMEFATRYMDNDPSGEIYGYGLNTRKVLKDIYEGTPWNEANKFMKPKAEGMPSHIDSLVNSLSTGKDMKAAMHEVNLVLERQKKGETGGQLQGSCGNGSAMRVAPLGAYLASIRSSGDLVVDSQLVYDSRLGLTYVDKHIIAEAALQSEPTHCHPEGIAGAIAITSLTYDVTIAAVFGEEFDKNTVYGNLLRRVPEGIVRQGIVKAQALPYETPIGKAIEILGNGTHVTCQDTVPLCCWLAIKHLDLTGKDPETYENAIIETSMAFGDVDTNCAIVGGIIGVVCPPPAKWSQFCEPMEGVL